MRSSQLRIIFVTRRRVLPQQGLRLVVAVSVLAGFRIRSVGRTAVPVAGSVDPVSVDSGGRRSVEVVVAKFGAETFDRLSELRFENRPH